MIVELRHLRCFLAIADEGTITGAANKLHLSQPVVSRTLRQLEDHMAVRLVDRSTHHLRLTPAGLALRERAAAAIAAVEHALSPDRAWPLRVGYAWAAFGEHTTPLLRAWRRAHAETPLRMLRVDDRFAGLSLGRVDIAVLRGTAGPRGMSTVLLWHEPRVVALAHDHPLAERPELALSDLADETIALNTVAGSTTVRLWPAANRPSRTIAVANPDDWAVAIASGAAVGVTSAATTSMHPNAGLAYVPLTDAPLLPVRLAWPEPATHPAATEFAALAQTFGHYSS
jgi:DNA-binding transcriptional LysR family regulator